MNWSSIVRLGASKVFLSWWSGQLAPPAYLSPLSNGGIQPRRQSAHIVCIVRFEVNFSRELARVLRSRGTIFFSLSLFPQLKRSILYWEREYVAKFRDRQSGTCRNHLWTALSRNWPTLLRKCKLEWMEFVFFLRGEQHIFDPAPGLQISVSFLISTTGNITVKLAGIVSPRLYLLLVFHAQRSIAAWQQECDRYQYNA